MNKGILKWFKGLSGIWQGITIISTIISLTIIATLAVDHFKVKVVNANSVINYLAKSDTLRKKEEKAKDSLDLIYKRNLELRLDSIGLVYRSVVNLTNSYATFIKEQSKTVDEFVRRMNGLEFTIQTDGNMQKLKPHWNIGIEPVNKKKK